ncbi:patatin-like phospholipase family protein [Mesonia ostreae]|uniref:Patatin-like phospholipase family protein n=1 Tax=Mesonia ostreae TaxID=861110 RepID=A0ABU2KJA5_9FLAO|nr:patatin-like phospholipase family protein [Mesonia ostreae]MDT0294797.1 patatin-like phospholipase family protein [Mesonia ostreae]
MRILFYLFLFLTGSAFAQQDSLVQKDLKVGLVLSGGGAKGLAHIGALKKIDEAGIRVDYIAGTSMGAIVGSLYAAGYTPNQLDSIFKETNFNTLIQDDLPRSVKTFYERKDSERYTLTLPFDDFKLSFPSGLSKGQNLYNLISQLTVHVNDIQNFKNLPIPFFCMGTDIETGEAIILESGSLAQAVSASGAIPTIFSPVEIDGRLVSDGGIANNYPIEELKARGADFIIGVDVQDSLVDRENLQSVFEIMTQVNNFRTISDMKEKREKTDLYIKPNIADFSVLSFQKGEKIIKNGEEAAHLKLEELKAVAKWQHPNNFKERMPVRLQDSVYINQIEITGNHDYPRNYIRGKLKLETEAKTSYKDLNTGVNTLSATGNFKRVEYTLEPNSKNKYNLRVKVAENENNMFLRLGLHYDDLYRSAALVNLTKKSFLVTNDIISLDLIAGDNFRYEFQYYIDKGKYWSIGLKSRVNQFNIDVDFDFLKQNSNIGDFNVNKVELENFDFTNQFYAETFLFKSFKFGVGAEHKYSKIETETIVDNEATEQLPFTILEQSNLFSAMGYVAYDTYDNTYFPSKGIYFRADFHLYLFEAKSSFNFSEFSIAKGKVGYAFSPFSQLSMRLQTDAGFRVGNNDMRALNFSLGGYGSQPMNNIMPFYGYDFLSITGDSYVKGLIDVDYEFLKKNHFIASYNIANVGDDLYKSGNLLSTPDFTGLGLGYGLETILGPIEIKYTYSPERGESEWFFSLGYYF